MSNDVKDTKPAQMTRRQMLRLTALGSAGLAVGLANLDLFGAPSLRAALAQTPIHLRIQADASLEKPVADLFIAKNPNVTIEYVNVTGIDHQEVASKILSMLAAGQPLDCGYACTEVTELYAGQKLSESITDRVKADATELTEYFKDVHPALIEAMMYQGDLYQLAHNWNAANVVYNTKLVKDAGFTPPAEDWDKDTFYNMAKAMTKKDSSGADQIYGFGWDNRLWGSWLPWIFVNNSNLMTEAKATGGDWMWDTFYKDDPAGKGRGGGYSWLKPKANDPANVEALDFVVQMIKDGISLTPALGGGVDLQGAFTNGKLGMYVGGGFWTGAMYNAGMAADAWDIQLWPKWKSQRHQFGVCAEFLFTGSSSKDMGWSYLKFMVSLEAMKVHGWFNPIISTTPARRSMLTADAFKTTGPANWQVIYDTLDKHPDTAPIPAPPQSDPMTTIFTKYTGLAVALEQAPQDALDNMQKDLEALFA